MYELKINLESEPRFRYGQKLFVVRAGKSKHFNEPCPICNDEKTITLKGIEGLLCPYCQTSYRNINTNNYIAVYEYNVIECFVNKIELKGEETKYLYKAYDPPKPRVRMYGFTKESDGYRSAESVDLTDIWYLDDYPTLANGDNDPDCIYTSKKGAEALKKMYVDRDKEKLRKFNEEHGTSYEYPFD